MLYVKQSDIFFYENYEWNSSIKLIKQINLLYFNKFLGKAGRLYNISISKMLVLSRNLKNINYYNFIWNWNYLYYILGFFNEILSHKICYNYKDFENYNLLVMNVKSKQMKISINTNSKTNFNLTAGKVLSSLKVSEKFKKKSNKAERLFFEFFINFLINNIKKFGPNKLVILKLKNFKKSYYLNDIFLKNINKILRITNVIFELKISYTLQRFKKIRSIKKRIKKKIIKNEFYFTDF